MFQNWLNDHSFSDYSFTRLFPPASDRAFWEACMGKEQIATAEQYLGYEWPLIRATQFMEYHKSGNRLAQERPHFDRRCVLMALFFGELAEHRNRFLPDIVDGIFAICEESYWGLSAHNSVLRKKDLLPRADDPYIDLFAAETAELLAVIYHVSYAELKEFCPLILERIEYELDRRIVTPYLNHIDFGWMGRMGQKVNNWNPWILSNILTVFLLGNLRKTQIENGLTKMFTEIQAYYDSIPADGGCSEGCVYWTKAGAKLFEFCDILYRTTEGKLDFFKDQKLKEIGLYETRTYIAACNFVNFSDGNPSLANTLLDYPLYCFGKRTGEQSLCRLAGTFKKHRHAEVDPRVFPRGCGIKVALFSKIYAKEIDAQPPFEPQKTQLLPDLQNAFLRRGDWYLAAKGGHNKEDHNHNDVGSFILYYKGEPLLIDPGCGTYTRQTFGAERYSIWTMQSGWHNLPVLNGQEQSFGETYAADSFALTEDTVSISFAGAYPQEAKVKNVSRRLTLTHDGLTLSDTVDFLAPQNSIAEHFISLLEPIHTAEGLLIGDRFLLETDLEWETEYHSFAGDTKLISAWKAEGVWRTCLKIPCENQTTIQLKVKTK